LGRANTGLDESILVQETGYAKVEKEGFMGRVLLWKPFSDDAVPPRWIIAKKKRPESNDPGVFWID